MRLAVASTIAAALVLCSCRSTASRVSMDQAAEAYARLVLALGERDGDSLDMYRGPSSWQREARERHADLLTIQTETNALIRRLSDGRTQSTSADDDGVRHAFLVRQLQAIAARVDILRGERATFLNETRRLFDLDIEIPPSDASAEIRKELEHLLPGAGPLAARYAAFDRRYLIRPERLEPVLTRAIAGCRAAAARYVPLPAGERVDLQFAHDLTWSATTRYLGGFVSQLIVNADLPLTIDRALDLACHEAYPGHHLIYSLLEVRFHSTRVELLAQPRFSPQTMLHEAAASVAPALAFSDEARLTFERDELFPVANLDTLDAERYVRVGRLVDRLHLEEFRILANYLDGQLDFPRAMAALERDALMPSPEVTLKFVNQFRSYAATYTAGRDAFAVRAGDSWSNYLRLVSDPAQRIPPGAEAAKR